MRRRESCRNAELQAQITASGFSTLSEYGNFIYFLATGDTVGTDSEFANRDEISSNEGQTLTAESAVSTELAEEVLSGFLGVELITQRLISLISNLWLMQVRLDELRPLIVCRNQDIQTLTTDLSRLSDIYYIEFVLNDEEALTQISFELSYRRLQRVLKDGQIDQSIYDDSLRSLSAEFDLAVQTLDAHKEKVYRLTSILESLAFYHNQAAIQLSSGLSQKEIASFCSDYDAILQVKLSEKSPFSLEQPSVAHKSFQSSQSHPLLKKLTLEEKQELLSLANDFIDSFN